MILNNLKSKKICSRYQQIDGTKKRSFHLKTNKHLNTWRYKSATNKLNMILETHLQDFWIAYFVFHLSFRVSRFWCIQLTILRAMDLSFTFLLLYVNPLSILFGSFCGDFQRSTYPRFFYGIFLYMVPAPTYFFGTN